MPMIRRPAALGAAVPPIRRALALAVSIALALSAQSLNIALADSTTDVEIITRARLSNNTEAATFVSTGRLQDSVVVVDGHDLLQFRVGSDAPAEGADRAAKKIVDLRTLPINFGVRGIAYIPTEQIFVMQEPTQLRTLIIMDDHGHALPSRTITYLPGFTPAHAEGLTYIPADAPRFGDRIVSVAYDGTFEPKFHVMTRTGTVEAVIAPAALAHEFVTGIGYRAPDQLLVGTDGNSLIWTVDFDGNVVGEPVDAGPAKDFEGIAQASDGRIWAVPYAEGQLLAFDADLVRLPQLDRRYTVGFGQYGNGALAWDSDLAALLAFRPAFLDVTAVPVSLDSSRPLIDLAPTGRSFAGITYLPAEQLIGVTQRSPRAVRLYDNEGTPAGEVTVDEVPCSPGASATCSTTSGRLFFAAYFDDADEFAFQVRNRPGDPNTARMVHFMTRTGTYLRTLDASAAPIGITVTHVAVPFRAGKRATGPEQLLLSDDFGRRLVVTDLSATRVLGEVDYYRQLNMLFVNGATQITSGRFAGAIAALDPDHSEIVIFRIER